MIAITGATGHIGNNLSRLLVKHGYEVKGLTRNKKEASRLGLSLTWTSGDILDVDCLNTWLEDVHLLIHCAGEVSIYPEDGRKVLETNVQGTKNILDACCKKGVSRVIYLSSIHAHESQGADVPMDEKSPYSNSKSPQYNYSKATAERLFLDYANQGLECVILNPTAVIGPHDYKGSYSGKMIQDLMRNKLSILVQGGFDWVDVRDLAELIHQCIRNWPGNEKFMISGHYCSLEDFSSTLFSLLGKRNKTRVIPAGIAYAMLPLISFWSKMNGTKALFTQASLDAVVKGSRYISHDKAHRMLSYSPRPFQQTLQDTLTWYMKHHTDYEL
jgi:dihydroflavonol-4-reductase